MTKKPVLIQRILIGFEAILENYFQKSFRSNEFARNFGGILVNNDQVRVVQ